MKVKQMRARRDTRISKVEKKAMLEKEQMQ